MTAVDETRRGSAPLALRAARPDFSSASVAAPAVAGGPALAADDAPAYEPRLLLPVRLGAVAAPSAAAAEHAAEAAAARRPRRPAARDAAAAAAAAAAAERVEGRTSSQPTSRRRSGGSLGRIGERLRRHLRRLARGHRVDALAIRHSEKSCRQEELARARTRARPAFASRGGRRAASRAGSPRPLPDGGSPAAAGSSRHCTPRARARGSATAWRPTRRGSARPSRRRRPRLVEELREAVAVRPAEAAALAKSAWRPASPDVSMVDSSSLTTCTSSSGGGCGTGWAARRGRASAARSPAAGSTARAPHAASRSAGRR